MNDYDYQSLDIRRRLRELQAIPDRDRTDAQWDELNELEIRTAPGNRDTGRAPDWLGEKRQSTGGAPGRRPERSLSPKNKPPKQDARAPEGARPEGRPLKRHHRRSKRPVSEGALPFVPLSEMMANENNGNGNGNGNSD